MLRQSSSKFIFQIGEYLAPKYKLLSTPNGINLFNADGPRKGFESQKYRQVFTSSVRHFIYQKDRKEGYDCEPNDKLSTIEHIKNGIQELKQEIRLWTQEWKELIQNDPIVIFRPGEIDYTWVFDRQETIDKFLLAADSDHHEGFSQASMKMSKAGRALFSGFLSTRVPKDGKIKRAGYCAIRSHRFRKSFKREVTLNWTMYNTLVLKVRGDGRTYMINLSIDGQIDITWNDMYHYMLHTRGGPYWQITKIPFSKFFYGHKGRIQDKQQKIPLWRITHFGIGLADKIEGPFSLEVEFVGLEFDPRNEEDFAYELYKTDSGIVGV